MLKIHNQSALRLPNVKKRAKELQNIFATLSKAYISPKDSHKHNIIVRYGLIEVLLVNAKQMRSINKNTRGIDKSTDVLSFPLAIMEFDWQDLESSAPKDFIIPLGSIVINVKCAKHCAKKFKHSLTDELTLLFIHALLHIFGFDHENDKGEQRTQEQKWIEYFKLPQSLITRTAKVQS